MKITYGIVKSHYLEVHDRLEFFFELFEIPLKGSNRFSKIGYGVMVFNTTFNNASVISWRSGLLVEETGLLGENQRPVASH